MVVTANRAAEICREWYIAFSNMGKGGEKCVLELLDVADTIEALEAALTEAKNDGMECIVEEEMW